MEINFVLGKNGGHTPSSLGCRLNVVFRQAGRQAGRQGGRQEGKQVGRQAGREASILVLLQNANSFSVGLIALILQQFTYV